MSEYDLRKRKTARLPDAELAVLKALWELGPASIRELAQRCYGDPQASAYSTVQKLLERLMAKRCVGRRREGRRHIYSALVNRSELIGQQLRETAKQLCEGSMTPLITHLIDSSRLTHGDVERLRSLIDQLGKRGEEGEQT